MRRLALLSCAAAIAGMGAGMGVPMSPAMAQQIGGVPVVGTGAGPQVPMIAAELPEAARTPTESDPPVVASLKRAGGAALRLGTVAGQEAYVVIPPQASTGGAPRIMPAFLSADRQHFVLGGIFTHEGRDVLTSFLAQAIPPLIAQGVLKEEQPQPQALAGMPGAPGVPGAQGAVPLPTPGTQMPTAPLAPQAPQGAAQAPAGSPAAAPIQGANESARAATLLDAIANPQAPGIIRLGRPGVPRMTLVLDANCGWSARAWSAIKPYIERGDIGVDVMMIGFLSPTSIGKAAAVIGGNPAEAALAWNFDNFGRSGPGGAAPEAGDANLRSRVEGLNQLWMQTGFNGVGVPVFLWRGTDGRVREMIGFTPNVGAIISQATGRQVAAVPGGPAPGAGGPQTCG